MQESESKSTDVKLQKARIRERYKGIDLDKLEVIPAIEKADFFHDESDKRVAVYARVSTGDPRQTSSYELQKNYYTDYIAQHPNWHLVDIYADEGISGTSLKHRDSFNRMITDCKAGKIDLIITKSVSRFARNIVDCISYVRMLKNLNPAVGIFFESESLYTLNEEGEMILSVHASLAQQESQIKSSIMNGSLEMRFSHGIFLTPALLGYDVDEEGNLVINEDEARTVRLIFFMFLYGYTCKQIAEMLTSLGRKTKKGNTKWSSSSIYGHLQNERYCGAVLARKTFTPDFLTHKSKKNSGQRNQYRQDNHHAAIISIDDYIAVQKIIRIAKSNSPGFLPELRVIKEGPLKGFVRMHTKWLFKAEDYYNASASAYNTEESSEISKNITTIEAYDGDIDMRGFEIARSQFFSTNKRIFANFTIKGLNFSIESIHKLNDIDDIEILIHPTQKILVVRKGKANEKNNVKWCSRASGKLSSKMICGAPFLHAIFEIMNWNADYRYRIRGVRRQNQEETVLIFELNDTEVFIPNNIENNTTGSTTKGTIIAYPLIWANSFGMEYYRHAQLEELLTLSETPSEHINDDGEPFSSDDDDLNITDKSEISTTITNLIQEFQQEVRG